MQTRRLLPETIRDGESRETLRRQRDFFEHLFTQVVEAFPDPVGVVDGEGTVAGWNEPLAELVGVDAETAVGRRAYEVVGTDDQSEALSETVARRGETIVEPEPRTGESADGELWAVRAKGFPLRAPDGDTVGAFQVNTVVTDVIRRNRALTDTQREITEEVTAATAAVRESLSETAADATAVAETVESQRRAVESIRSELSSVASEATAVRDRADTVDETTDRLDEAVTAASDAVETAVDSAETATRTGESAAGLVDELDEQADAIGVVAETIDEIADRTNLLALNA
ncbi:MAG: PAS sensor histidine kinase, partial [halophilic archaeon J07HB67]